MIRCLPEEMRGRPRVDMGMYNGRMGLNGICVFLVFLHGWRSHLRANHLADTTMKGKGLPPSMAYL